MNGSWGSLGYWRLFLPLGPAKTGRRLRRKIKRQQRRCARAIESLGRDMSGTAQDILGVHRESLGCILKLLESGGPICGARRVGDPAYKLKLFVGPTRSGCMGAPGANARMAIAIAKWRRAPSREPIGSG